MSKGPGFLSRLSESLNPWRVRAVLFLAGLRVKYLSLSRKMQWAVGIAVFAILALFVMPGKRVAVTPISVETISNYRDQISALGKIRPSSEYFLSLNKGGKIDQVFAKEGDLVREGQTLAVVDESVRTMGLKSALTAFRLAARDMARVQSLLRQGAATEQEVDETRAKFDLKRSELENAKSLLSDGVIRSPVAGRLSVFVFQVGDRVPDGARVGVVQKVDDFEAIAKFPFERKKELVGKRDVVMVLEERARRAQNITLEQGTFALKADVQELSEASDFDGQNVDLRIKIGELPRGLRAGDTVEITVVAQEIPQVSTVRSSAVKWRDQKPFLLFRDPSGELSWRAVKVGNEVQGRLPIWGLQNFEGFVESEKSPQELDTLIKKKSKARIVEGK